MISKSKSVNLFCVAGLTMLALSACGAQSAADACNVVNKAGAKLLPEIGSAIEDTSSDPSGTLKRFQTAAADFKTGTASIGNPQVKEAKDLMLSNLDKMITSITEVEAAGKAGKSQDELHVMVLKKLQPLANTFQNDWNTKLAAACGG